MAGTTLNNLTGKYRQNVCVDVSGNVNYMSPLFSGNPVFRATSTFGGSSMEEGFKAAIGDGNGADSAVIFRQFYSASAGDVAALTGSIFINGGASKIQATAVIGLIESNGGASDTAGVALGGYAIAHANNSHVFGLNSNASDCTIANCGFNTTSPTLNGFEADCNANNAGSACTNIIINGVYNTGASATGIAFAKSLGTKGTYDFGISFALGATAAPGASNAAVFYNPVASGASQVSQGEEFQSTFSDSTANFASLNLSAAGNLTVATSRAGTGFLAPILTAGNTLCAGIANGDGCFTRSATTGAVTLGSDGNVILFRNASNTLQIIGASLISNSGLDLGSTSFSWGRLFLNNATAGAASMTSLGFASSRLSMNNNNAGAVNVGTTPLYTSAGTEQLGAPHIVQDTATLAAGTVTVTLTGAAVFTNATSYTCTADDDTAIAATRVLQNSGSSITIQGTGTDVVRFVCTGN